MHSSLAISSAVGALRSLRCPKLPLLLLRLLEARGTWAKHPLFERTALDSHKTLREGAEGVGDSFSFRPFVLSLYFLSFRVVHNASHFAQRGPPTHVLEPSYLECSGFPPQPALPESPLWLQF